MEEDDCSEAIFDVIGSGGGGGGSGCACCERRRLVNAEVKVSFIEDSCG